MRLAALGTVLAALVLPITHSGQRMYPLHTNITATVFWIGEPEGSGSTENNALSAWDDAWLSHYDGFDDYRRVRTAADGYFPHGFRPRENPFYVDLPYDDFRDDGKPRADRLAVVPWASSSSARLAAFSRRRRPFSLLKNRWLKLMHHGRICYAQWEDSGPYLYDDANYVFSSHDARPRSSRAHGAGLDVSPAVRDCLRFNGLNNDENTVDWQFVDDQHVPRGPWLRVVTKRQVFWR